MPSADEILLQLKANNDQLKAKIKQSENLIEGLGDDTEKSGKKGAKGFAGMTAGAKVFAVAAVAAVAVAAKGLFNLGKAALVSAANLEKQEIAFATMLGSASKAKGVLKEIRDFSASTPLQQDELIDASKKLIAFGEDADNVVTVLGRLGDVSSGLGIPLGELSEIYGKARVQQKLFAEDLNQLAGRGVPIFTELADVMGVNASEVKKLGSEGKITFDKLEQVFINLTKEGGKFGGLLAKQSLTLAGRTSTLNDLYALQVQQLGTKLTPAAKELVSELQKLVKEGGFVSKAFKIIAVVFNAVIKLTTLAVKGFNKLNEMAEKTGNLKGVGFLNDQLTDVNANIEDLNRALESGNGTLKARAFWEQQLINEMVRKRQIEEDIQKLEKDATLTTDRFGNIVSENSDDIVDDMKNQEDAIKNRNKAAAKGTDEADARKKEIELLTFLGQDYLAELTALEIKRDELLKEHGEQRLEIEEAFGLRREELVNKYDTFVRASTEGLTSALDNAMNSFESSTKAALKASLFGEGGWNDFKKSVKEIIKDLIVDITIAIAKALALRAILGATTGPGGGGVAGAIVGGLFEKGRVPEHSKGTVPSYQGGNLPPKHELAFIGTDEAVINARSTAANSELLNAINNNPGAQIQPSQVGTVETVVQIDGREVARAVSDVRGQEEENSNLTNFGRRGAF